MTVSAMGCGEQGQGHPLGFDIIQTLEDLTGLPIANMAHWGDEVRQMFSLKERQEVEQRLGKRAPDGHAWDAMLFSGGGNDFVGDQLCIWLNSYSSGMKAEDVLNATRFDAVLRIIEAGYRDLIEIRNRLSPKTKLFFHQYDYAPPSNEGVCNLGPWLRPSLDFRRVPLDLQAKVVELILDNFAALLKTLASKDIFIVQTLGTFPDATDEWWANELHPTDKGFAAIAEKFRNAMKAAGVLT